jgi:hypothetical protein
MAKQLMVVAALGVLGGIAAEVLLGERVGISVGLLVAVLGTICVVLVRNQRDLAELQYGQAPAPRAFGGSGPR